MSAKTSTKKTTKTKKPTKKKVRVHSIIVL